MDVLIEKAKQKDKEAFFLLIQRYMAVIEVVIRKYIRNIVGHEEEDVARMVILWAWEKIPTFQDGETGFKCWLSQKAKWICLDLLAEQKKKGIHLSIDHEDTHVPIDPEDPTPGALENLLQEEREQVYQEALDRIPEEYRTVISLRYTGLSYKDIAKTLDIDIKTVGSRLNRGIKMLREHLQKQGFLE